MQASVLSPPAMLTLLRLGAFRNAYLLRGAATWGAVRIAAAFVQIGNPAPVQEFFILLVVALAVWLDARRRGEDLFLANLGVRGGWIALWALPGALALELAVS